jgi:hypothetical protein
VELTNPVTRLESHPNRFANGTNVSIASLISTTSRIRVAFPDSSACAIGDDADVGSMTHQLH